MKKNSRKSNLQIILMIKLIFIYFFFSFTKRLKTFCDNKKKMNEKNKEYNSGKVSFISDTNKYSDMVTFINFLLLN